MILIVDNFDSFTFNLVDYCEQLGLNVEVLRNNVSLDLLLSNKYQAVVLSPGPGTPFRAGRLMDVIDYYYNKKPILGICLGHQAIAEYFGGRICKAEKPMHGKISEIMHNEDKIFCDVPKKFNVVRYHSLICDLFPTDLKVIARTHQSEIMALKHKRLPIYGLQFHPEAVLTEYGLKVLENWKNINSLTD